MPKLGCGGHVNFDNAKIEKAPVSAGDPLFPAGNVFWREVHVFKLEMFFVDILFPEMSKVILAFQICEKFGNFGKSELTLTLKSFSTNACLLGAILPKFKGYSKI